MKAKMLASVAIVAMGLSVSVQADTIYDYSWNRGDGGVAISDAAGKWESFHATYNATDNTFSLDVTFSNRTANALTFAISGGPNPKNHPGQLAYFYLADGIYQPEGMTLSAYGYNGKNTKSWKDGDGSQGGNQTPDLIASSEIDNSWIHSLSKTDNGNSRTFSMKIDASIINGHTPLYPSDTESWTGVEFGEKIGIWARAWDNQGRPGADYDHSGKLKKWWYGRNGYFDGNNLYATVIPLPPAVWLGALGIAGVAGVR
ncbi:MAG: hypothetical protein AAF432_15855, partial [Planctomycetota bacterium]